MTRSCTHRRSARIGTLIFVSLLFALASFCGTIGSASAVAQESAQQQILCLHTERFPYIHGNKLDKRWHNTTMMARELARQAFVVAAIEELHIAVRDQTIGESWPHSSQGDDLEVIHVAPLMRTTHRGKCKVRLYAVDPTNADVEELWTQKPLWEKAYEYKVPQWNQYRHLTIKMEKASRSDFVDALQLAGIRPADAPENSEPKKLKTLSRKWQRSLAKVDFTAQLDVARDVHQVRETYGGTPELTGNLVRAYSNLSLLTNHFFSAATDAYAARALLYAGRMQNLAGETEEADADKIAQWHQLYASAMTGLHNDVLKQCKELESKMEAPAWAQFILPYIEWDSEKLQDIAESKSESAGWARLLWFQETDALGYAQPVFEAAEATIKQVPLAFGVYTDIAKRIYTDENRLLSSSSGTRAFTSKLPRSLTKVSGLPKPVVRILKEKNVYDLQDMGMAVVPGYEGDFTGRPNLICDTLRKISADSSIKVRNRSKSLSWSALAYLIEEQQFNTMFEQFHYICRITVNDESKMLTAMVTFLKNHRYNGLLKSLFYHEAKNRETYDQVIATMRMRDIRYLHHHLLRNLKNSKDSTGKDIRHSIVEGASANYTARGFEERINTVGPQWDIAKLRKPTELAKQVSLTMPGSAIANRLTICANRKDATVEQLIDWEAKVKRDPASYTHLGFRYAQLGDHNEALRCYLAANELLPRHMDYLRMSQAFYSAGQFDQWQEELEHALEVTENIKLRHARINLSLAKGLSVQGKFREARSFAVKAADSYAAWALVDASKILESLSEWKESEELVKRATLQYSASEGEKWYFWCRRTGRGDVEEAHEVVQEFVTTLEEKYKDYKIRTRGIYALLEDDPEEATEMFNHAIGTRFEAIDALMVIQLAGLTGNEVLRAERIEMYQPFVEKLVEKGSAGAGVLPFFELMRLEKNEPVEAMMTFQVDEAIRDCRTAPLGAMLCYFMGEELRQRGETELAKTYFRRALIGPEIHSMFCTLAGARLCEMNESGKSRPDKDELDVDTIWPPFEPLGREP